MSASWIVTAIYLLETADTCLLSPAHPSPGPVDHNARDFDVESLKWAPLVTVALFTARLTKTFACIRREQDQLIDTVGLLMLDPLVKQATCGQPRNLLARAIQQT